MSDNALNNTSGTPTEQDCSKAAIKTQTNPCERALTYAESLASLIRIDTVSTDEDPRLDVFHGFHDALKALFPLTFSTCEVEDFEGSLLLRWPGANSTNTPVLFMHHMDVVEPNGQWSDHEPFSGDIAEGRLWGRGTLDTKTGLWGMLTAAEELLQEGYVPPCDIYFESSCSEEITNSGADAISQELERRGIRFRFILDEGGYIVHDPLGGADADFAMIGVGEKPLLTLRFVAKGNGGHASTPGKDTPLVRLGRFVDAVDTDAKKGKLFKVEVNDVICEMLRRMAPAVSGPLSFVFAHSSAFKPALKRAMPAISETAAALVRTTIAFTMAEGSEAPNVLPTQASVTANIRCAHHQGIDATIQALEPYAKRFDVAIEIVERGFESPLSSYDSDGFRLLEQAISNYYPETICSPYVMNAASDAKFMSRVSDVCLRFAPFYVTDEQVATIHAPNENINIDTLPKGVDCFKYIMKAL